MATPAFGPEPEVLRLSGPLLIREVGSECRVIPLDGSTLAELAAFAGADLGDGFAAGPGTPALGPTDEPLRAGRGGAAARSTTGSTSGGGCSMRSWRTRPSRTTVQLWPEHFDVGSTVDVAPGAQ